MGKPSYDDATLVHYFMPISPETCQDGIAGPLMRRLAEQEPDLVAAVADVDRSLIRECLSWSPAKRLVVGAASGRFMARFVRD